MADKHMEKVSIFSHLVKCFLPEKFTKKFFSLILKKGNVDINLLEISCPFHDKNFLREALHVCTWHTHS